VRVASKGLATGGKPESELTGTGSHPSADVKGVASIFSCFSAGRRVRFSDRCVLAFTALGSEVGRCFNRSIVATAIDGSRSSAG
jgi:hypothetical protein